LSGRRRHSESVRRRADAVKSTEQNQGNRMNAKKPSSSRAEGEAISRQCPPTEQIATLLRASR
jgi:hypothetical protein